jgi:hypothetical protein
LDVTGGDFGQSLASDPGENLARQGDVVIDSPSVSDRQHVREVVGPDGDRVGHRGLVDEVTTSPVGQVEEGGNADDVGAQLADPLGQWLEVAAGWCGKTLDESRGEVRRMIENVERSGGIPVVVEDNWGEPVDPQKLYETLLGWLEKRNG